MYSFLQYRTSQTPSVLVLPILGYSWNCIQTIISRTLPHLDWLIFKLMKINPCYDYLSSVNLEKAPELGIVPHKSLFDTSLHKFLITWLGEINMYRDTEWETWRKLRSCDIQYLKVSEFSEFSGYPSSQPVAVHSPAWTLRQSFQISHLLSGPTLSKYLTSELPV